MFVPDARGHRARQPLPTCNRTPPTSYVCVAQQSPGIPDRGDTPVIEVPPASYLMIGDNRDNSADGRDWGFVPEANLVGKATRIWFNLGPEPQGRPGLEPDRHAHRIIGITGSSGRSPCSGDNVASHSSAGCSC